MEPDLEALREWIGALEARLRNTRLLVVLLVTVLVIGAAITWLGRGTVRAKRVEVVDGDGTVRMVLDADKGPSILLYGLSGYESIAITALDETMSAIRIGGEAHARLTSSSLLITASDSGVVLSVSGDNRAVFQLLGDDRRASVDVEAGGGTAGLKMRGGDEYERIEVGSN